MPGRKRGSGLRKFTVKDMVQPEAYPSGARSEKEMTTLEDFNLSDFKTMEESPAQAYPDIPELNLELMIKHFLTNTVEAGGSSRNAPEMSWKAILDGLVKFAAGSSPEHSIRLFGPPLRKDYSLLDRTEKSLKKGQKKTHQNPVKAIKKRREDQQVVDCRVWLDSEIFGNQAMDSKEEEMAFAKEMSRIMRMGVEVDPDDWGTCLKGYALGFWLAKLYNELGFEDEKLPHELNEAKQRFLELYGYHYESSKIIIN